ncbi:hypothetical protein IAG44_05615 [Streptomyces roseirectus]|uniref:Uncharacterized protein n=1 Tax=Streptomyces roseirectus TaxID=2768066 RepID=A0A7H0I861_9ACTN|nr:hypothetical protein [Streptomyces roseirectus]QNP68977.1 hypothetical protein IAG44_05615 [Streptomyces roseirectus]
MESYDVWTCAEISGTLPAPRRGRPVDGGLLGRETELTRLRAALAGHRLVTVTGAAGMGKSRLAGAAVGTGAAVWVGEDGDGAGGAGAGGLAERVARALDAAGFGEAVVRAADPAGHSRPRSGEAITGAGDPAGRPRSGEAITGAGDPAGQLSSGEATVRVGDPAGSPRSGEATVRVGDPAGYPRLGEAITGAGDPAGQLSSGEATVRVGDPAGSPRSGEATVRVGDPAGCPRLGEVITGAGDPAGHPRPGETAPRARRTPEHPTPARPYADPGTALRALPALPAPHPLLVLDGVDPVHAECVGLVQRLLMAVPALRILVTARTALGLGDEHVLKLGALSADGPAVDLFLSRARTATGRELDCDGEELAEARRICRLLEGVPLAIELAASQLTRHSVRDLAARLERDQCWLTGPHPGPRRHRSLRDAVGAGYRLCERESRVVWARASVFAGSFTEATAVFLCAGAGVEPYQVPGLLARLAASGVLETLGEHGGPRPSRYRMTRAARDFGAERLRAAGESAVAHERHALHFRRVAAVAENLWSSGQQRQAVQLVRDEYDDLTALVRRARSRPGQVEAALEAVVHLWFWWAVHGHAAQGHAHLRGLLPLTEPDSPLLPRALWLMAWLGTGDPETARELLGRAWTGAVLAGDGATVGRIAHVEGLLAWREHSLAAAESCFAQAADLIPPDAPGGPAPAVSLAALAIVQSSTAPRKARRTAHRALAGPGAAADTWSTLLSRYALAVTDHPAHPSRTWHRARRALATVDTRVDAPQGTAALLRLIADVERGRAGDGGFGAFVPAFTGTLPLSRAVR